MSELRKRFEKETGKTVGEIGIYECSSCGNDEVEAETWNDNYVFWLENLANGVSDNHEKALPINSVMASALPKFIELLNKGSFFISAIELDMDMDGEDFKQWLIKFVDDVEKHLP